MCTYIYIYINIHLYMYTWNPRDWRDWLGVVWPIKKIVLPSKIVVNEVLLCIFIHLSMYLFIKLICLYIYLSILFWYRVSFSLCFHDISIASPMTGSAASSPQRAGATPVLSGKEKRGHVMAVWWKHGNGSNMSNLIWFSM